ncbi:hypothetical protein JEQ12_010540 [Ovis aries]|uniref:Uncharacterized protein n=1 Tax=Ovis aries TaxID=9940 RepID=A0A835ZT71_SHEEP|nr:hypothetical protein JEQ12_010540 [Ovis aries]
MNGFSTETNCREGPPAAPAAAPGCGLSCLLTEDCPARGQRLLQGDVRQLYMCDFHKNFIQSVQNKRQRKTRDDGGDSPEHDTDIPEVDLFQLQVNTLRQTDSQHFSNIPVNEKETLTFFMYMVRSNKSRLDRKSEGGKQLE